MAMRPFVKEPGSQLPLSPLSRVLEIRGWSQQLSQSSILLSVSLWETGSPCLEQGLGWCQASQKALFPLQVQSFTPENLLFVSTLDGSLHALSKQTGDLKWTLKDGKEGLSLLGP